jgi:hypothetical protein
MVNSWLSPAGCGVELTEFRQFAIAVTIRPSYPAGGKTGDRGVTRGAIDGVPGPILTSIPFENWRRTI